MAIYSDRTGEACFGLSCGYKLGYFGAMPFVFVLFLAALGSPVFAQITYVVDRSDDAVVSTCSDAPNDCTLRGALTVVDQGQTILFDPQVFPADTQTVISVTSPLPPLDDGGVSIIGNEPRQSAPIPVVIDGSNAGSGTHGLHVTSDDNYFHFLQVQRFDGDGIFLDNAGNNRFSGDFGANRSLHKSIICVENGGWGIRIRGEEADNNRLAWVWLGSDLSLQPRGNGLGGLLVEDGPDGTVICEGSTQFRALANHGPGIVLRGDRTQDTILSSTGSNSSSGFLQVGSVDLPNDGPGILVQGAQMATNRTNFHINQISIEGNLGDGIRIESGHGIHLRPWASTYSSFKIRSNQGLAINLVAAGDPADGVTPNDSGDGDSGPNTLLNKPVIQGVAPLPDAKFELYGTACSGCDVYVFASEDAASGHGGSDKFLEKAVADQAGHWVVQFYREALAAVTAYAVDGSGNMSEFSRDFAMPLLVVDRTDDADVRDCSAAAGDCTLRGALASAQEGSIIFFDPSVFAENTQTTIEVTAPLPLISQPGLSIMGPTPGQSDPERVVIDGSQAGSGTHGLYITSSHNYFQHIQVQGFDGDGIYVDNASGNRFSRDTHNYSRKSIVSVGNGGWGVHIRGEDADDNRFAWTWLGVLLQNVQMVSRGNGLGGILIEDGPDGTVLSEGNTTFRVQANFGPGIVLRGENTTGTRWSTGGTNNSAGYFIVGSEALPNRGHGILVQGAEGASNEFRSNSTGIRIEGNEGDGVRIESGHGIHFLTGHSIYGDVSISGNQGLDINLVGPGDGSDGVTANDPGDRDQGANGLLNFPEVTAVLPGSQANRLVLEGTACSDCRVFIFESSKNPSGHGGIKDFLGETRADSSGAWQVEIPSAATGISLYAIDGQGNMSEFSENVASSFLVVDRSDDDMVSDCTDAAGDCTLRGALSVVQSGQTILFDETVFPPNRHTLINITSPLPVIDQDRISIIGNFGGQSSPLSVVIDGSDAGSGTHGLHITSDNNLFEYLQVQNFSGNGIFLDHAAGNRFSGDYGVSDYRRNSIVSIGNGGWGIHILGEDADQNRFAWTWVGVTLENYRQKGVGNGLGGILIEDGPDGTVLCEGSTDVYVMANHGPGIVLKGTATTDTVWSTRGSNSSAGHIFVGSQELPNRGHGILVQGAKGATNFTDFHYNSFVIEGNRGDGIRVESGDGINFVPTEVNYGSFSIRDNQGLAINLVSSNDDSYGVTPNDEGDGDHGPNGLLNFPLIDVISFQSASVFSVTGESCADCRVHLFTATEDPSGHGQLQHFLSSTTADVEGRWVAQIDLSELDDRVDIAAIAQDDDGNMSEVSPNRSCNSIYSLLIEPMAIDFGAWALEDSVSDIHTVAIYNDGTMPAKITAVNLQHSAGPFFVVTDSGQADLAPGETRTIQLQFDPEEEGVASGSLVVETETPSFEQVIISLQGEGLEAANLPPVITQFEVVQEAAPSQQLSFSVTAEDPEGDPLSYNWSFGDGGQSDEREPSHSYEEEGEYVVEVVVSDPNGGSDSAQATVIVAAETEACPQITGASGAGTYCNGIRVVLSVSATGENLQYQWSKDGQDLSEETGETLVLDIVDSGSSGSYVCLVSNSCGQVASQALVVAVDLSPEIQSQPQSQTVVEGSDVTFHVAAEGSGALSYQWLKDNHVIQSSTSSELNLTNVTSGDAGQYHVIVSNDCGQESSHTARLQVQSCGVIEQEPESQDLCRGQALELEVSAVGSGLQYQWFKDGMVLADAHGASYRIGAVTARDAGTYHCEIQQPCGTLVSQEALVSVLEPVSINTPPSNLRIEAGQTAVFSVVANGSGTLEYQWLKDHSPLPGATQAILEIEHVGPEDEGHYRVVVRNQCGAETSSEASLSLTPVGSPAMQIQQVVRDMCPQVDLLVLVTDSDGNPVEGLTTDDFSLFEDGQARAVELVQPEGGTAMALALDHSSSLTTAQLASMTTAVQNWIFDMQPLDQMALFGFDDQVRALQQLSSDPAALDNALSALKPGGKTALYDAVYRSIESLAGVSGRKMAMVLSDGQDNASRHGLDEVLALLRSAGVPLISVGFGRADWAVLEQMAAASRGLALRADQADDLPELLAFVNQLLQGQYHLRFETPLRDNNQHTIVLEASVQGQLVTDNRSYPGCPPDSEPDLLVSVNNQRGTLTNGVVDVPLFISNNAGGSVSHFDIFSYEVTLQYPGQYVKLDSVSNTGTLTAGWLLEHSDDGTRVTVRGEGSRKMSGQGPFFVLTFRPHNPDHETFCGDMLIEDAQLNGGALDVATEDGELCLLPCNPGDTNGDGVSDSRDAQLLESYLVGNAGSMSETMDCRGDVTGNGSLSSLDAALIYDAQRTLTRADVPAPLTWSPRGVTQVSPERWRAVLRPEPTEIAPISAELTFERPNWSDLTIDVVSKAGASVVKGDNGYRTTLSLIDAGYFEVAAGLSLSGTAGDPVQASFNAAHALNQAFSTYRIEEQTFNERAERHQTTAVMLGHGKVDRGGTAQTILYLDTRHSSAQQFSITIAYDPQQVILERIETLDSGANWTFTLQEPVAGQALIEAHGPLQNQILAPLSLHWRVSGTSERTQVQVTQIVQSDQSKGIIAGESILVLDPQGPSPNLYRQLPYWGRTQTIQNLLPQVGQ